MIYHALCYLNEILWSYLFLPCAVACGTVLTIRCGALQLRRFSMAMKMTVGSIFKGKKAADGAVTPFQAAATALASTVGTGNIIGTAQAIAMGGPGRWARATSPASRGPFLWAARGRCSGCGPLPCWAW